MNPVTIHTLMRLYREACALDVQAFKPGNVSHGSAGHGMSAALFLASAEASAPAMVRPDLRVGSRVLAAVQATSDAVACNTNLGIVLLTAPLLQACLEFPALALRDGVQRVLASTTVADADAVYWAIRIAAPGGLGHVAEHDVAHRATLDLTTAMRVAAGRDLIARQYANGFDELFEQSVPFLAATLRQGVDAPRAMTALFMHLLARLPDSHIRRKHGDQAAEAVLRRAAIEEDAWMCEPDDASAHARLAAFDRELKSAGINPGTTADLCVASFFSCRLLQQTESSTGATRKSPRTHMPPPAESAANVQ